MHIDIIKLKTIKEDSVNYQFTKNVGCPEEIYKMAQHIGLWDNTEEEFWILCLNTKMKPCGLHMVSKGNLNSSIVHPREIFKRAILNNAASIICIHNHPSGDPSPSQDDLNITKRIDEAGTLMGVPLVDHIIIGDGVYISFKEKMLL
jgi:DNA repair protein RadC